MTAGTYNVDMDIGADFALSVTWTDQSGTLIDLTGWSAEMMIKQNYTDTAAIVQITSATNGGITLGGAAGTIGLLISSELTTLVPPNVPCLYDLKMTDPNGIVWRLLEGTVNASPAIST